MIQNLKQPQGNYVRNCWDRATHPHSQRRRCGGRRRDRRARLRHPWAAAGPGRTTSRRTQPHASDTAPPTWRAPEGPEGLAAAPVGGGTWTRCRWVAAGPGRASRSTTPSRRLACGDLAGGPPPTGTHSGRAPQSSPAQTDNAAPGTPVGPQATKKRKNP